jgi:hypothetical protein
MKLILILLLVLTACNGHQKSEVNPDPDSVVKRYVQRFRVPKSEAQNQDDTISRHLKRILESNKYIDTSLQYLIKVTNVQTKIIHLIGKARNINLERLQDRYYDSVDIYQRKSDSVMLKPMLCGTEGYDTVFKIPVGAGDTIQWRVRITISSKASEK